MVAERSDTMKSRKLMTEMEERLNKRIDSKLGRTRAPADDGQTAQLLQEMEERLGARIDEGLAGLEERLTAKVDEEIESKQGQIERIQGRLRKLEADDTEDDS